MAFKPALTGARMTVVAMECMKKVLGVDIPLAKVVISQHITRANVVERGTP